jgi:hypothetical protein
MTQTKMNKFQRELAGTPTEEIKAQIESGLPLLKQSQNWPKLQREQLAAEMCDLTTELERRENGGAILADIRRRQMTDGEYLAAGLEPPNDNL